MASQRLEIFFFVVGFAILPALKQNSDPLVGEGSQCGMVILATSAHLVVVSPRPFREPDRLIGKLVKRLLDELWASQPVMNRLRVTAAFSHWSNTGVRLHFDGGLPSGPISTERGC